MRRLVVLAAVIFTLSGGLLSQTSTSSVHGTISDQQGAVLAGAAVTLSNPGIGFSQSTKTDGAGVYQFLQIPPGTYMLTVSMAGFAILKMENLELLVNLPATANATMRLKAEVATVEVESASVQVNTQDATIGNAFGTSQIATCPLKAGIQRRF